MPEHIRTMANAVRSKERDATMMTTPELLANVQYVKGMADGMDATAEYVEKMRI